MEKNSSKSTYKIVVTGLMAAIVFVLTLFIEIPLFGSRVHFANSMCILSGLLLGPVYGGLAAGIGSGLFDFIYGYGVDEALITFASKFAMAAVAALIAGGEARRNHASVVGGSVIGAWTYVALYMLKTFIYRHFVYGLTIEATFVIMGEKIIASTINAIFAITVAPVLYFALKPVLEKANIWNKLK